MTKTTIAVLQMNSQDQVNKNLVIVENLVKKACLKGATLCVLPENFAHLGNASEKLFIAESLQDNGPILSFCQALASQHQCELILGGFPEKSDCPDKVFNSCIHLDQTGEIKAVYRKIHLFDIQLDADHHFTESATVEAGNDIVVTDTSAGKMGLSICYDLRFPELYRQLTFQGATSIAAPAAFTFKTGEAHWEILLRARAIENQVYILAAAQTGDHPGNRRSYGHACIIDPWGEIIAMCHSDKNDIAIADIDFSFLQKIRQQLPCLQHKRL